MADWYSILTYFYQRKHKKPTRNTLINVPEKTKNIWLT